MDRFGRRYATVPGICIFATGMVLMPFTGSFTWLLLAAILMRLGNGIASGTMMTLGADLAPREGTGEFLGLWRLTGDFGGSVGPVVVGNLADLFGLSYSGFALGGIGYLAVGIFLWAGSRDIGKRRKEPALKQITLICSGLTQLPLLVPRTLIAIGPPV